MFELQTEQYSDGFDTEAPFGAYQEGSFEDLEGGDGFGTDSMFEGEGLFEDLEGPGGYEASFEGDGFEVLGEGDGEGDQFLGSVWRAAKKVGRVVAPLAKKFAPQIGTLIGGALGGPAGAALGGKLGTLAKSLEGEDEGETEAELNAMVQVPAVDEAVSEAMAAAATKVNPSTAQSMGSALTITIASQAPLPVKAVLPVLAKASGDVARQLAATRDPRARTLIRVLPTIQRRTIATLTAKARAGKPITPRTAVRVMRRQAQRVLVNPQAVTQALANNAQKKGKLDKAAIARAERYY